MYCSQCKYEYFCATANKNFKCVYLEKILYFITLLFIFILLLFYNILFFLLLEYLCTTGNKNFKRCVFLKSILFELADGISHVLAD